MSIITEKEIEVVKKDLALKGIDMPGLENDLLDHLLCNTEVYMSEGNSFAEAYQLALLDLHDIADIQKHAIKAVQENQKFPKDLANYSVVIVGLILIFNFLTTGVNPALILVCLSLGIFFIYHAIFSRRKGKSLKSNVALFTGITTWPITGVLAFLLYEFPSLNLAGLPGWCLTIVVIAIPVYVFFVKKIVTTDSTTGTFFRHTFQFMAVASFLWILLALPIRLFQPHTEVLFFLDDLGLLGFSSLVAVIVISRISEMKRFLLKQF
jgi:hypothetical protein